MQESQRESTPEVAAPPDSPQPHLRLFINGERHDSRGLGQRLRERLRLELNVPFELDVVDVIDRPELAEADHILATPTLILCNAESSRRVIGNFIHRASLLGDLGLGPAEKETVHQPTDTELLFKLSPDGCLLIDNEGKLLFVNEAAAHLLGRGPEKLIGKPFGRPISDGLAKEVRLASGAIVDLRMAKIAWKKQDAYIVTLRDISDRKRMEDALRESNTKLFDNQEALEHSNREFSDFAHLVSHDIKSPLRTMNGFADLLLQNEQGNLSDRGKTYLAQIAATGARLSEMVDNLLAYARVDGQEPTFQAVSLDDVLQEVLHDLDERIKQTDAKISSMPLPVVQGDARQLYLVLLNLLDNALKYRRPDRTPTVHLSSEIIPATPSASGTAAWRCKIDIQDNGVGFDPAHAAVIFQPFQRVAPAAQFEGSGIGLGTVQKIVARHGGTVAAASKPGEGATFTVTFRPAEPPVADA